MIEKKEKNSILEMIEGMESIAISGHLHPDGDCIGSALALYHYIKENTSVTPDVYLESPGKEFNKLPSISVINSQATDKIYDLFIMLDVGDKARLGFSEKIYENAKKKACIDHHITSLGIADMNIIRPSLSSTSELLYELMEKEKISKETASCLYTGIIHDTGVFHHSCTSKRTMEIAGELMEMGIPFPELIDESFYQKTYKQNQMLGRCLMESLLLWEGIGIVSYITKKEMDFYMVESGDLIGIIDQLRLTEGVKVAILIYENEAHTYKVSMRSTVEDIDVSKVAAFFGGGGHKMAAGCTLSSSRVHDIINNVTKQIEPQLIAKGYLNV